MDGFQVAIIMLFVVCGAAALWVMMPVLVFLGGLMAGMLV